MERIEPDRASTLPGPPRRRKGLGLRERSVLVGGSRSGIWSGLVVSIAAHVVAFGGALVYAHLAPARTIPEKPIIAKLVRLGKPRDEKLLPRLPTAPPPPPPAATAPPQEAPPTPAPPAPPSPTSKSVEVPAEKADPTPKQPAATASNEALERQRRMMEALGKLGPAPTGPTSKVPEEAPGQADGDAQGTADDAAEGDRYLGLVEQALRANYEVPTIISPQERIRLKCVIFLKIAPNGKIEDFRISEESGNPHFDRAVESSIQRTTLPPPPPAFLKEYGASGIEIGFKP